MKTVLFFQTSFCDSNQRQLAGVYAFARAAKWSVQIVEYATSVSKGCKTDLKSLFAFWNPDGCIVDCGGAVELFARRDFGRIPTVFLDRDPSTIEKSAVCVTSDALSVARMAARELLSAGLAAYAYVDWFLPHAWSVERGDAFAEIVDQNGKRFYRHRLLRPQGRAWQQDLMKWLKGLPKPCGVFAANDRAAGGVVSAAVAAGLEVPRDILVVGVDNDVLLCENSPVATTSVPIDREGAGRIAAELLDQVMRGRTVRAGALIKALPIVRRASTRRFSDSRVLAAVEYVRLHACEGLKVDDVVKCMNCSRSLAYLRFGEALGHSILDEIHQVRLTRAKELLRDPRNSVSAVSDRCGYASVADFRRTFKRMIGFSPRKWLATSII